MILQGRTVLITGGGSGIGAEMATLFAKNGASVVISGRRIAALEQVAATSDAIRAITADVTDEISVKHLFQSAGHVDIVIANAGDSESAPFHKTTLDAWHRMMNVNLTGVFLTLREGLTQMTGWGRLISVASTAGLKGYSCRALLRRQTWRHWSDPRPRARGRDQKHHRQCPLPRVHGYGHDRTINSKHHGKNWHG